MLRITFKIQDFHFTRKIKVRNAFCLDFHSTRLFPCKNEREKCELGACYAHYIQGIMYFTLEEKGNPKSTMLFSRLYSTCISSSETMPCLFHQSLQKNYKSMHSLKTYIWSQLTFPQSQKVSAALLIA